MYSYTGVYYVRPRATDDNKHLFNWVPVVNRDFLRLTQGKCTGNVYALFPELLGRPTDMIVEMVRFQDRLYTPVGSTVVDCEIHRRSCKNPMVKEVTSLTMKQERITYQIQWQLDVETGDFSIEVSVEDPRWAPKSVMFILFTDHEMIQHFKEDAPSEKSWGEEE